jgi:polyisoprenoid-binding protein YceI
MSNLKTIAALGIAALVIVFGVMAYSLLRAPEAASGQIEAIPLVTSTATAPASGTNATEATDASTTTAAPTAAAVPATDAPTSTSASTDAGKAIVGQIVQGETEARFIIDEVLNNAPKTVVGTTDQVAGELAVDPSDPTQSQVGVIQINARTLTTDSEFRNRAIKNQILNTDQYEFITFTPTQLVGLPESGALGQSYTFQIVGDLTIRDVTQQVTFDVTATPVSQERLEGTAQTTINYADYGISIPQVRQVASVDPQARLELDFVAVPK